jgi:LmbE family N-acetylglucosaminyl deacetylase
MPLRPDSLPLHPSEIVRDWGATLVVAPHQDDESLGCGGAIALLRAAHLPVRVLFVSDGAGSHPGSRRYPGPALSALRNAEARAALAILGVAADACAFLGLPDRSVPRAGTDDFSAACAACRAELHVAGKHPETILLPWRRDPHTDHRASWELVMAALGAEPCSRLLEYPIWLWELGTPGDAPVPGEVSGWRLDISSVVDRKQRAIAAHRSQTTPLIDDDPRGWVLPPEILARFAQPWEVFLEAGT